MKNFLRIIITIVIIILLVFLGVLLGLKIKNDTLKEKEKDIEKQNIQVESEYLCDIANKKITAIKDEIKEEINLDIEVADVGSLDNTDIYFVTKVDNEYRYIIKEQQENKEVFKVAQDNEEGAKYIVSLNTLGLDTCLYTSLKNYNIDKEGKITYINNN